MPRNQAEAIVLRASKFKDQDKSVVFFSREHGLIEGIAKGALKSKKRFGSSLEPMSYVKVFYYEKEGTRYVTVGDCDLIEDFYEIQTNPPVLFTLAYFAELIEESRPAPNEDDLLFRLLLQILRALKAGGEPEFLAAYFETWFLKINGYLPDLSSCKGCRQDIVATGWLSHRKDGAVCESCANYKKEEIIPEFLDFLKWVKKNPPSKTAEPSFSLAQIQSIRGVLKEIIVFHLEHSPKTLGKFLDK
ncbi:MAG: DNA repair protein RecO [Candidatus Aminicenantes bacterium]|nr:DNA repair protein RecO [Candidatus Aminicenantes bacterium]